MADVFVNILECRVISAVAIFEELADFLNLDIRQLFVNATKIGHFGGPKFNLNKWSWIQTLIQWRGAVGLDDFFDLVCPINNSRLDGMKGSLVCFWGIGTLWQGEKRLTLRFQSVR